jgi:deoxyribodipyrimidine photolyase-related protein
MKKVALVFPNQLFEVTPFQDLKCELYLVEEFLFFNHYKFHKQKIAFHRATMKRYSSYLSSLGFKVSYINAISELSDVRKLISKLIKNGLEDLHIIEPNDNWLEKHIKNTSKDISITWYNNPLFINTKIELDSFFNSSKKKFFQTSFYKQQRVKRNILMSNGEPFRGKINL